MIVRSTMGMGHLKVSCEFMSYTVNWGIEKILTDNGFEK
jgi:hypothetical protein